MLIIIVYNRNLDKVISKLGRQNKELYDEDTIDEVEKIFLKNGYEVRSVDGNLDMFENLREINRKQGGLPFVFNMAYGIQGESRYSHIPSILEMLGLPYLGSGPEGHTLALDKIVSKIMMGYLDIPTPSFRQIDLPGQKDKDIGFPLILKPAMEASSFGVKLAHDQDELNELVSAAMDEFNQPVFIEEFIRGKEYALGLLGNGKNTECLPLVEIELDQNEEGVFDSGKKQFRPGIRQADIPHEMLLEIEQKAKKIFHFLRLRDYARVDIRIDEQGKFWFLEVNSMAGLRTTGLIMGAAEIAGYSYEKLIIKLFETARRRYSDFI